MSEAVSDGMMQCGEDKQAELGQWSAGGCHLDEQKTLEGIQLGSSGRRELSLRGRAVRPWRPQLPFIQVALSQQ